MPFTNEDGSEGEDHVAKKRCPNERDGRSREYRMIEEKEHPRREHTKDEINLLNDKKRKSYHSPKDAMINRFNERFKLDTECSPSSTKLLNKERSGHHHRGFRELGGRTDECCRHVSSNHQKVGVDLKWHTKKHHSGLKSDLERTCSSNQRETGFISRCSNKHNELTQNHRQMSGPNDNPEEWNRKYKRKRFGNNYRTEF